MERLACSLAQPHVFASSAAQGGPAPLPVSASIKWGCALVYGSVTIQIGTQASRQSEAMADCEDVIEVETYCSVCGGGVTHL